MRSVAADKATDFLLVLVSPIMAIASLLVYLLLAVTGRTYSGPK